MKASFLNCNKIVPVVTPGTAMTGRVNSDWVSVAHGSGVVFSVTITEGRANQSDDNTITLQQGISATGNQAKTLRPTRAWLRQSGTSLEAAASATATALNTSDMHTDGDMANVVDIEIDASELDTENDYGFVRIRTEAVSGATSRIGAVAIAVNLRHKVNPTAYPDVLA